MLHKLNSIKILLILITLCFFVACNNHKTIKQKEIVKVPEKMDDQISDNIKSVLDFASTSNGSIGDSIQLAQFKFVNAFYSKNDFKGVWSKTETWNPIADSMFQFIKKSKYYGLYPEDYHFNELKKLRSKIETDSLTRMDAVVWTRADLMLTDAFMKTLKDLKEGRLLDDSVSIVSKENAADSFFIPKFNEALASGNLTATFDSVEPKNIYYASLKEMLPDFVDNMDTQKYAYINFPYIDTLQFYKDLHKRLLQSGIGSDSTELPDSVTLSKEIKKYQKKHKLTADGKVGEQTVSSLNSYDYEKFRRIAVTLDRYKELPQLPEKYLMVNIPAFGLRVWDNDSVVVESKVIVGKPTTPTPLLTSAISNMVTYPNWTIPESIIKKDILPALKVNPGYLAAKGFVLVDYHGNQVDPYKVKWAKYTNGIPWKIVQLSGYENALGIFKFNFSNPYFVYLHDTNQRYLFSNTYRALSHGCVRVQNWEAVAFYIAKNDSLATKKGQRVSYNADSIKTWVANEDRKTIIVKKRLPLYIEYFTCDATNNKIVFYDDIYNKDQFLEEKFFADKSF
ncbi:MAG: L,D-transpeptidase family protein [Bacteroidota bacterium]|nr:L,D-transpeptidase family protein [Bacteroidota bacterium]